MCPLVYNIHFDCFFVFFIFHCFFAVSCCLRYTPRPPPCKRILRFSVQTIGASCDINAIVWVHTPCNFTFHTIMTGPAAYWMQLCENDLCVTMSWLCAWFCSFHMRKNNRPVCADPKSSKTLQRLDCLEWVAINLFVSPPASYDTFLFIYLCIYFTLLYFTLVLGLNSDGNSFFPVLFCDDRRRRQTQIVKDQSRGRNTDA